MLTMDLDMLRRPDWGQSQLCCELSGRISAISAHRLLCLPMPFRILTMKFSKCKLLIENKSIIFYYCLFWSSMKFALEFLYFQVVNGDQNNLYKHVKVVCSFSLIMFYLFVTGDRDFSIEMTNWSYASHSRKWTEINYRPQIFSFRKPS